MAEYMGRDEGHTNSVTREYAVADGVTVTDGDFVYLTAGGRVSNATITSATELLGTVLGGDTQDLESSDAAVGNAAGTVKVLVNIERDARYLIATDGTVTEANVGDAVDLQGNTGAQTIDLDKVSPTGQLVIVQPGEGLRGADDSYAVVRIKAHQLA